MKLLLTYENYEALSSACGSRVPPTREKYGRLFREGARITMV